MLKKIAIALFIALSLLWAVPAQASMLMPFGGWLMDKETVVKIYTDYSKLLRVSAQHIRSYDSDGMPLTDTITWVDYPFDGDSTALGFRHCKSEAESTRLAAIYSPKFNKVFKAWSFDGKKFNEVSTEGIKCSKGFAE
jgi:hypothetical protein